MQSMDCTVCKAWIKTTHALFLACTTVDQIHALYPTAQSIDCTLHKAWAGFGHSVSVMQAVTIENKDATGYNNKLDS